MCVCVSVPAVFQSEYGDIYKATLVYEGETVTELRVKYFDTLPVCVSLAVLKTGFLFTASETGNHALYQFVVSAGGGARSLIALFTGCKCRSLLVVVVSLSWCALRMQIHETHHGRADGIVAELVLG